jgi:hypothetical protein
VDQRRLKALSGDPAIIGDSGPVQLHSTALAPRTDHEPRAVAGQRSAQFLAMERAKSDPPVTSSLVSMDVIIRVARIAVVLILVVLAVSLVIGMSRPETGAVEKLVLTALVAGCIAGGAVVTRVANRLRARLAPR